MKLLKIRVGIHGVNGTNIMAALCAVVVGASRKLVKMGSVNPYTSVWHRNF